MTTYLDLLIHDQLPAEVRRMTAALDAGDAAGVLEAQRRCEQVRAEVARLLGVEYVPLMAGRAVS